MKDTKIMCKVCGDTVEHKDQEVVSCNCGALHLIQGTDGPWLAGDPDMAKTVEGKFVEPSEGRYMLISDRCACGRPFVMKQVTTDEKEFSILRTSHLSIKCPDCGSVKHVACATECTKVVKDADQD